jgi:hypothetical protein
MTMNGERYTPIKLADMVYRVLDTKTEEVVGPFCLEMRFASVEAVKRNVVDAANKAARAP